MEKQKFTVTGGIFFGILVMLIAICNLGLPLALIILGIIKWEGVLSYIFMCVLALVAFVIFGLPTIPLLNVAWAYLKVDGTQFLVRSGLFKKYTATCSDLKKVYCYKEKGSRTGVTYYISITFEGRETFNLPYGQRNFKRLAKYFYEMCEAGVISEKVIRPSDKKILLHYSRGEFSPKKRKRKYAQNQKDGTYSTSITLTKIRDKEFLRILLPLLIWGIIVFICLIIHSQVPSEYSLITVSMLFGSFLLIIPVCIVMFKKIKKFSKGAEYIKKTVFFDVMQGDVYMDAKKVNITVNTVSGLFNINVNMLEGYIVNERNTGEFRDFLDKNEIPYEEFGYKP